MLGRFDEARAILSEDRADQEERGGGILLANLTAFESVWVELWAGDAAAAAKFGAEGWRLHLELGQSSFLPHAAANRARALYALGQLDEAEAWAVRAAEFASESWTWTEMLWRQVRAKVHARRGEHADAERLAREAVAICDETELLDSRETRTPTSPRCSSSAASPTRQPPRLSRRLRATSGRETSSWPTASAHGSRN